MNPYHRITAHAHQRFRESTNRPTEHFGEIDQEVGADPIHDHRPRSAPKHKVNRVLGILDQLDRENSNRRFNI